MNIEHAKRVLAHLEKPDRRQYLRDWRAKQPKLYYKDYPSRRDKPANFINRLRDYSVKRAKENGWPHDISSSYLREIWLRQGGKCALTGLPMQQGGGSDHSASLDRIDNDRGYEQDNVRFVCYRVNILRGNLNDTNLLDWCSKIIAGR